MYKVMIVDDDFPVIEFLQKTVPWSEIDLTVTGAFTDGERALEHAKTEGVPDILVTDIGMPKMNGLELIAQLQKVKPDVHCVILSCHDEFKYAQQAVKLGVNDYILKETMDTETIVDTLNSLCQMLNDERKKSVEFAYFKRLVTQNHRTIFNSLNGLGRQKHFIRHFELDFSRWAYAPVLISVDGYRSALQRFQSDDVLLYAVQNIVKEVVSDEKFGIVCFRHIPSMGIVLLIPDDRPITPLLQKVQRRISDYLRITVSCMIEKACRTANQLNETFHQLLTSSADYRFYLRENSLIALNDQPLISGENLFLEYSNAYEELYQAILSEDRERLAQALSTQITRIRTKRYRAEVVKEWFLKMLLDIQLKAVSVPFRDDQHHERANDILHTAIGQINSLDELQAFAFRSMQKMMVIISRMRQQPKRLEVLKAQQYVLKHLDKKITQEEVAAMLHFNTSYFSRLFKRETGESFSRYVMTMKMERAKDYLRTSTKTVEEISHALGYENKGYFFKLFKQYTGMTPAQYAGREQLS